MRLRLLLPAVALLAACSREDRPLQLDFVGATGLTSGNRTANPADTVSIRLYANTSTRETYLARLRVTALYEPGPDPFRYPAVLATFKPENAPPAQSVVVLDSVLNTATSLPREFVLQATFGTRSTSGTERWEYTVTDSEGNTATRAYVLTVRKADSAAAVHTYNVLPRPNSGARALTALNLRAGLLLPRLAFRSPEMQNLIDLIALRAPDGTLYLAAPASSNAALRLPAAWPASRRRSTELRSIGTTALATAADNAGTIADFQTVFDAATTLSDPTFSPAVVKTSRFAFRTQDGQLGTLNVTDVSNAPIPVLSITVRVAKP